MEKITYTKKDIIDKVSKKLNIPKDEIKIIFECILDSMSDIICEQEYLSRIEIRNFGIFDVRNTKAKPKARNPRTNEEIYVPPRKKVHYKPGKNIKKILSRDRT